MISPLLIIWLPPSSIRHTERIADFKAWVNFCPTQLYSGGYILAGEYIGVRAVSRVSLGRIKGVIYGNTAQKKVPNTAECDIKKSWINK